MCDFNWKDRDALIKKMAAEIGFMYRQERLSDTWTSGTPIRIDFESVLWSVFHLFAEDPKSAGTEEIKSIRRDLCRVLNFKLMRHLVLSR